MTDYDVAVVGAGPAGSAAARRLALAGCSVLLLERSRFDGPRPGESLAPAVQPLLRQLGVWNSFTALQPLPSYGTRSVWGGAAPEVHSHIIDAHGCGWHIDRTRLDQMLAESAKAAGAQLRLGVEVVRVEPAGERFELRLAQRAPASAPTRPGSPPGGDTVRARFVVDAAGRASHLPRKFGVGRARFDRLVGVAIQFHDPDAPDHCYTLLETCTDGWWYAAPVARDVSMVMLMTDGDLAGTRASRTSAGWRRALARTQLVRHRVDGLAEHWGPRVFAAVSQRLLWQQDDARRWLSVGDSALAVDPVSGSGVVRALRTADAGARVTLAALEGDRDAIVRYEVERDRECAVYLRERERYYRAERRFADAVFWRRRSRSRGAVDQTS